MREPLDADPYTRASGPHKGIETKNVDWLLYLACSDGETVNATTYEALHTTMDLDAMYDLIEMKQVHASWMAAAQRNAEEEAERRRRIEAAKRGLG